MHYLTNVMDKNKKENNPFNVPESYFSQLHDQIMARVAENRLKDQVSSDGYTIPGGYFEKLPQRILDSRDHATYANDISGEEKPIKTLLPRKWISYAAAACVTIGVSTFSLWQVPIKSNNFEQHVAAISDADIINYLQYYSDADDGTSLAEQVTVNPENFGEFYSKEDLESYLEQTL
ncbi:hypothetical protein SAMN05216436_11883 [bacterium A37T11]|nr:hypothetical protein SAMN05216436_11883 [bacterium A37T11]